MSAGVILANQQGVVVSVDSASTYSDKNFKTTFDHAKKVFLLKKDKNYGVVLVGNANLSGHLWSTLIGEYIHNLDLKDKNFQELISLVKDFRKFLVQKQEAFQFHLNEDRYFYLHLIEGIQFVKQNIKLNHPKLSNVTQMVYFLKKHQKALKEEHEDNTEYSLKVSDIVKKYLILTKETLVNEFQDLARNTDVVISKVATLFLETLVLSIQKGWYSDQLESELSFFGYGEKDLYPSVITFEVYGFFQGQLIYGNEIMRKVDVQNSSYRIPIGQSDVSESILEGIPHRFIEAVDKYQDSLIKSIIFQAKKENIPLDNLEKILKIYAKLKPFIHEDLKRFKLTENKRLISIDTLDIEELYSLTKGIIQASILKSKFEFSRANRTVGGSIQSILMSKRSIPKIQND